jgi:hypothetical protein
MRIALISAHASPSAALGGVDAGGHLRRARSMCTWDESTRQLLRTCRSLAAREVLHVAHAGSRLVAAK